LEVSSRSTEEVLQEVFPELERPQHEGGCGDSGRFATLSVTPVPTPAVFLSLSSMCRWLKVSNRSTEEVLQEVLSELERPQHEGGCGDSGRFDKATQAALKRYVPKLKLFSDADRVSAVLHWVAEAAALRRGGQ
jgi:hypothetical protein